MTAFRRLSFLAAGLSLPLALVAAPYAAQAAGEQAAGEFAPLPPQRSDLSDLRWQARPVLLFAPSPDDPGFRDQKAALEAARAGLAERDIVVLSDTDPAAGGRMRQALNPSGFTFLLVGKDGGVKMRRDSPVSVEELFSTIDAMPMRRNGRDG